MLSKSTFYSVNFECIYRIVLQKFDWSAVTFGKGILLSTYETKDNVYSFELDIKEASLTNYKKGSEDKGLDVLYFNFGRYLLISSSRLGGAANLQGI